MTGKLGRRAGARARLAAMVGVGLVAAAGLAYVADRQSAAPPSAASSTKPKLLLLTTLPLVFGETFGLEGGSPALEALEKHYTVTPVGVADAATLEQGRLLLMAHPLAQPPEALVDLDRWVREGGRLLLLADPALDWPSERPLGDAFRPPPAFADTGLLAHWGLRLDAPDKRGPVHLGGGHNPVIYFSPGRLVSTNPDCDLSRADIIAECKIGKGRVAVVADADFLNVDLIKNYGVIENQIGNQTSELLELLDSVQRR